MFKALQEWIYQKFKETGLQDFFVFYFNPTYDREYETEFNKQIKKVGRPVTLLVTHITLWAGLITWPLGYLFYNQRTQLLDLIFKWRALGVTLLCLILILDLVSSLIEEYGVDIWILCVAAPLFFTYYYGVGSMGGLDTPWFYSAYIAPGLTLFYFNLRLHKRIIYNVLLSLTCLIAYFGFYPQHLNSPYLGTPLSLLAFFTFGSVIVGHMVHNVYKQSYINSLKLKQERNRAENEHERAEDLLLNILPEKVAGQLKDSDQMIADGYDEATVLFADIVDFTPMADDLRPTSVVMLLDDIVSSFDKLVSDLPVEKIKTVGDEYFVASGIPQEIDNHAVVAANLATCMLEEVQKYKSGNNEKLDLRIGLNTGPVVAGVIGTDKFVYDVWGDTVNVGSRMETQGKPGQIQVTPSTKQAIQEQSDNDEFKFISRGQISVKGKGMIETFFLEKNK